MYDDRFSVVQGCLIAALAIFAGLWSLPVPAQNEGLTFEQAQTRTAFARRQMQEKQRELKKVEAEEEAALRNADQLKKRYEAAMKEAEAATKARQDVEQELAQARERWMEEAERLKRIHDRREQQPR